MAAGRRSRLVTIVGALLASSTSAQTCDYSKRGNCINAEASASVKIDFAPLFTSPPTLVFAIDNLEDKDVQDFLSADKQLKAPTGDDLAQAIAFWFEYDNSTVNFDSSQERAYYAWALESNSTNDIGGNDGGCENLLGAQCVSDLKSLFTGVGDKVGESLVEFFHSPPAKINCPNVLWDDGSGAPRSALGGVYATPLWAGGIVLTSVYLVDNAR